MVELVLKIDTTKKESLSALLLISKIMSGIVLCNSQMYSLGLL